MTVDQLSWDDIRLLLAASRAGSLSALARELGVDPTTVGRRTKALERSVRLSLFQRGHGALGLTDEGRHLLRHARQMEEAARAFRMSARNLHDAPEGLIRISAPPTLARFVLAPGVAALHRQAPGITVEIETEPANVRLETWEADIAVRLGPPTEVTDTLLIRKVGQVDYAVFEPEGAPVPPGWAAYAKRFSHVPEAAFIEEALDGAEPVMRANDPMSMAQAVAAGVARTVLPVMLGTAVPGLRQAGSPVLQREVWLLRNPDTGEASAVRTAHEWIVALFEGPYRWAGPS
ncbi:LysR family transcriptional regulator [Aestuariicoccus sp. MJ-SS9]|uniref:LysR family transcriptional regulator n=1 Tax=Aestuariicoccus sp. MJ-SS9 TaxID=3079855 RepID=UPI0029111D7C|nr:LysR family transcriptional regulator [Aestuariicoccus sp. MJ-SS9]MDU8913962.1 LysR family transcriptional regulator [Aestuariicoccus sp. MJ-SS9]